MARVKVFIIDDSAIVRDLLSDELSRFPEILVVGTAMASFEVREKVLASAPDVLVVDGEMGRFHLRTFLGQMQKDKPLRVVIFSDLTPAGCLRAWEGMAEGIVEVLQKPEGGDLFETMEQLREKILSAALTRREILSAGGGENRPSPMETIPGKSDQVVLIGATTGGVQAVPDIVMRLPEGFPGVVVALPFPARFTRFLAAQWNEQGRLAVHEAKDGEVIQPGLVLVAPGDAHVLVQESAHGFIVRLKAGILVHHHRPSLDVLFASAARLLGRRAVGVLLTGSGTDGVKGLRALREAGGFTLVQEAASCLVPQLPETAFRDGAACAAMPLNLIAGELVRQVSAH